MKAAITLKGVLMGPAPSKSVEADVYGIWAAHRAWSMDDEWSVTHTPTGGRVASVATEADAQRIAQALAVELPNLGGELAFGERPGAAWQEAVGQVLRVQGVAS